MNNSWEREASLVRPAQLSPELLVHQPLIDTSRPWAPNSLLPLADSEKFSILTEAQQLRYNHIYARQLIAQIIWAESDLARPGLLRLLRLPHPHESVAPILQSFISDETNHIESYSALAVLAVAVEPPPVGYTNPLFSPPILVRALTAAASRFPQTFNFWIRMVEALEIYTVKIGQMYLNDETVDPLFRKVFASHARDEARNCRLDRLLIEWLRSGSSGNLKTLNDRLEKLFEASFMSVEWGLDATVRELVHAHPELADSCETLLAETKALRGSLPPLEMFLQPQ